MSKAPSRKSDPDDPQDEKDPNAPPSQLELDESKPSLKPEEAAALLRAGHRLRKRGDDPANWIAMTRHQNDLVLSIPATPDALAGVLKEDLIIGE